MAKFDGTIFRFPLRSPTQYRESLLVSKEPLRYFDLKNQLDETYFQQAKRSLILLRNLKQITFHFGDDGQLKKDSPFEDRTFSALWNVAKPEMDWTTDKSKDASPLEEIMFMNTKVFSERRLVADSEET